MTLNEKDLLLKDLCARLPYGVKAYVRNWSKLDRKYYEGTYTVASIHPSLNDILVTSDKFSVEVILGYDDYEIKPYLFPLSSMTEEQKKELYNTFNQEDGECEKIEINDLELCIYRKSFLEFLNKYHFDWMGLIPNGLALDATGLNIY